MFKWFKKLKKIVKNYDSDKKTIEIYLEHLNKKVHYAEKIIRDRTEAHVDIHYKHPHTVFLIGKYKNRDFFEFYETDAHTFDDLLYHLNQQRKARLGRIDADPTTFKIVKEINKVEYGVKND